jgi:cellulose synthase/poly-beta-1,6-N-acetylglucosamine synthase-like glycosyltransferase
VLAAVFAVATVLLIWVYAGYPALAFAMARLRPVRLARGSETPSVSVAIAVHDEEKAIGDRIADVLAQAQEGWRLVEVLVGSDGSQDGTDDAVRAMALRDTRIKLLARPRGGQTATQSALFEAATGDIVVLTDAETRFEPHCLSRLVAPFGDPRVGCATGKLQWRDVDATATASNEGMYWRYERAVRDVESHAGLLTAVTGALLAVRRSAYRPVPATASMDHLLPLYVRERGGLVVYVADAVATDRPISGLREQFRNRSRTATRGIAANLSMATRLTPWRHPSAAIAIWSHKLLRWATPWLIVAAVVSAAILAATTGDAGYGLVVVVAAAALAGAAIAHVLSRAGLKPPALLAFLRAFAVVNLAFVVAWWNVLRGRRIEAWHRADWRATG